MEYVPSDDNTSKNITTDDRALVAPDFIPLIILISTLVLVLLIINLQFHQLLKLLNIGALMAMKFYKA